MRLHRHDLVWIRPKTSFSPDINQWIKDYPCVAARSDLKASQFLKVAFPLSSSKEAGSRISFTVEQEDILNHKSPISLAQVVSKLSLKHFEPYSKQLSESGYNPCVYGSYAWQAITGRKYISDTSDLDLLIHVNKKEQLDGLDVFLNGFQVESGIKIDGELIFAEDYAVSWREWYSRAEEVLVKTIRSVCLMNKSDLLEK